MGERPEREYREIQRPKMSANSQSPLLQLPPEIREPIIRQLSSQDALQLRLTCSKLNSDVEYYYDGFAMDICGDSLNTQQLNLVSRINVRKITFKRVAKPLTSMFPSSSSWMCSKKATYEGPSQYFQVGGIQVRSLSAPFRQGADPCAETSDKTMYEFSTLRQYLFRVGLDDIFKHL